MGEWSELVAAVVAAVLGWYTRRYVENKKP